MKKTLLTLEDAKKIAAAAEAEAVRNNWPVVIGEVVGGIGVSGVRSHQDAQIAQAGVDALVTIARGTAH